MWLWTPKSPGKSIQRQVFSPGFCLPHHPIAQRPSLPRCSERPEAECPLSSMETWKQSEAAQLAWWVQGFCLFVPLKTLFLGKKWCKTGKLEQNLWFVGLFVLSHSRLILKIAFVDKQIHAMQHQITSGHQLNHVRVVVHKFIR